ncbi:hypothetical protein B0H10DRAFT_2184130 [Mycena sp. CBHHK59/15]|nr:hypothetical protein B0H10DRAFT_2184130 [Mycena sp. CBHHK59/15]
MMFMLEYEPTSVFGKFTGSVWVRFGVRKISKKNRTQPNPGNTTQAAYISVATTPVPDFNNATYKYSSNGYWEISTVLGFCHSGPAGMFPTDDFDPQSDVPASIGNSTSVASQLFEMWGAMGVVPGLHFILLYTLPPSQTIPISPRSMLSQSESGVGSLLTLREEDIFGQSPPSAASGSSSPAFLPAQSSSTSVQSHSSSTSPVTPPTIDRKALIDLCSTKITGYDGLQGKASFHKGIHTTPLVHLACNFYAMESILSGLSMDTVDLASPCTSIAHDGAEIMATPAQILEIHRWNATTFSHKRTAYSSAKLVAERSWRGDIPGILVFLFCCPTGLIRILDSTMTEQFKMYTIYSGIKFAWRAGGPVDPLIGASQDPLAQSSDHGEKCAAGLKQKPYFFWTIKTRYIAPNSGI